MEHGLPEGYQIEEITAIKDPPYQRQKNIRKLLAEYMQSTYQELCPQPSSLQDLRETVDCYFSDRTPVWLLETARENRERETVGCLWMGTAVDLSTGNKYAHIFLIFVAPEHRRRGLGKAMMGVAEKWAIARGDSQIGLQVFARNQPAMNLYRELGYNSRFVTMSKTLGN